MISRKGGGGNLPENFSWEEGKREGKKKKKIGAKRPKGGWGGDDYTQISKNLERGG